MGSLKFAIGLSLLSYESRRLSLCTSFKFSDGLPVSLYGVPTVLFGKLFPVYRNLLVPNQEPLLTFVIICKLSKEEFRAFSVPFESGYLGTFCGSLSPAVFFLCLYYITGSPLRLFAEAPKLG